MSTIPHFLDDIPAHSPHIPCREQPDLFVDSSRTTQVKEKATDTKTLCARCPVRDACTDHAIANGYRDGIWGGLAVAERDQLAANAPPSPSPNRTDAATGPRPNQGRGLAAVEKDGELVPGDGGVLRGSHSVLISQSTDR